MYSLPTGFDFLLLSGCYLEMVCFGARMTKLEFSRPQISAGISPYRVSFCVEGGLRYKVNGVLGQREFIDSSTSAPLLDCLLQDVLSVKEVEAATLQILFSSGDNIVVEPDNDSGYEAYSIYLDSGDVVVV
ncbi:hypothetical protein [Pseudomonas corrugata]|uniref:Uncharacterized protein n=1 Tax=Pseudomonas corrugata TaxID=47879 RepID=A0A8B6UT00_9PSED|nr:hypothetical protein [Pseudomonas corrugata]QTH15027.1 hypothetical protein C4C32_03710 [Pseudomonas corrugata]